VVGLAGEAQGAGTVMLTSSQTLACPWKDTVATMEDPWVGNAG